MARQCTKPKRPINSEWFKEKAILAEALESGVKLDEEQMAFLAYNGDTITINVLSEVPTHDNNIENHVIDQNVQETRHQDALSIIDTKETLELAEKSRLKMHAKQNDPIVKEKKVNIAPINYVALNKLSKYFVKNFAPQKQLSAEQAFWLPISKLISELPQVQSKVFAQMESEVAKCSVERKFFEIKEKELLLENDRLLELLISQDLVHTVVNFLAEIIDYQSMEKSFLDEYSQCVELKAELSKRNEMVEKAIYDELLKRCARMENICISLEIKVQQYKEVFQNNQPRNKQDALEFPVFFEINELKAQLKAKDNSISKLKDHIATIKGKSVSESNKSDNISKVISPGMYKLDLEHLSLKLLRNREAHVDYLKHTQENIETLCEILEQARELRPLDSDLDYAYKFITRIQELLVYVSATCPNSFNPSEKLITVTPRNINKKVKFVEPRVISSTSVSRSKPSGNIKKNRISRPTSRNKKNKVEDHIWSVKPSLNKNNCVSEHVCNANVKHSILNVNSELICATCNECQNFTIDGNMCPLTRITSTTVVPSKKPLSSIVVKKTPPSGNTSEKLKDITNVGRSNHPLVPGPGLLQAHDEATLSAHQLFAFRKHSCYVRDLEGVDLLTGSRGTNLYTLFIEDMMKSSPICLLSKAPKTKSWLWHQKLSHLNFGTINNLAKQGLVRGLPKLKYEKDHLCSACSLGKSKKHTHKPKSDDSIQEKLYLLHMDLYGPMRIKSINGKKYILVIMIQVRLNATVRNIRIDNGTEFVNQTLKAYYEDVGISHQTSVARTPQQNDVVEIRNRTLVEVSRMMLICFKAPLFLWAEAVTTACYTQNRSLIRKRHNKTPYELLHDKKPDLTYFHVFRPLCYLTNDVKDLGKLKPKDDIGIFIGYAPAKKAYRIYN
ncbi:retrovirus-related pol polyprotein from transposon TNT 1-94 [Tanacetum coccineum]